MKFLLRIFSLLTAVIFSQKTEAQFVKKVESMTIVVSEMQQALNFYTQILPFEKISDYELTGDSVELLENVFGCHIRKVGLQLGNEKIFLVDYLSTGGKAVPENSKSNDLWFQHLALVVSDMDKAYGMLHQNSVTHVSNLPQTLPASIPAAAGITAFYFEDPDHHILELIHYPAGKGDPKWQEKSDKLFLGIDHTAIGVSSTDASLKFYSGLLGLQLKGESFNSGKEQAHLNNVKNASLHISGLRATNGPGIEFLQYLFPGPGEPYPADVSGSDLIAWQTCLQVDHIDQLWEQAKLYACRFVTQRPVLITENNKTFKQGILRDPDGHLLLLQENITGKTVSN